MPFKEGATVSQSEDGRYLIYSERRNRNGRTSPLRIRQLRGSWTSIAGGSSWSEHHSLFRKGGNGEIIGL